LCVKSNKESWQHTISQYKLSGEHYLLNNKQFEILSSVFQITGVPHYILVDKKGNIVDQDAKRPSDPKLINDINKLL
jgi:hypothetical protein